MAKRKGRVRAKVSVINEGAEQRKKKNEDSNAGSGGERKSKAMVFMEEDLRNLHCFLKELGSCRDWMSQSHPFCAKTKSDLLIELSDVLFGELLMQFEKLHALLRCPADGVAGVNSEAQYTREGFILLLRCCLTALQFLEFDMTIVSDKCGILVKILGELFAQNLAVGSHGCNAISVINSFSHNSSCLLGGRNAEADEMPNLFSLIIEVLIAEFSENLELRKHLTTVSVLTANSENFSACNSTHNDDYVVLELVCSHFLLSVSNGLAVSRFLHLLSGSTSTDIMTSEISLDACLKLISTHFILSAPYMLQAHIILLASRCIRTDLHVDIGKSDALAMSRCVNTFELSVNLYLSYLSTFQTDDDILGANGKSSLGAIASSLDYTVHKMTWDKLTDQANYLVDFFHLHSEGTLSGTEAELLDDTAAYIQGNHTSIDQLCKDATCFILNYMITNILPRKVKQQRHCKNEERIQQEVFCLAAAMKLMNSSLLQIIWLLRQAGCHGEKKTLGDCSPCKAYESLSLSNIISCFNGCGADQQVQKFLCDMLGAHNGMHQEIKFMLAHILSLLIFSFRRKLNFLWKGCISMMMTLMNLLLFEERNLGLSKAFKNIKSHDKGLTHRSSSLMIATNLKKTRKLYLKNEIKKVCVEGNRISADEKSGVKAEGQRSRIHGLECINDGEVQETHSNACSGERFLECIPSYHADPSQWEDLVDFIECDPQKDYLSWLKNCNKFKKWKEGKAALLKRQKWKKNARSLKRAYDLRNKKRHDIPN